MSEHTATEHPDEAPETTASCAWPDGCENPASRSPGGGRPGRYCQQRVAGRLHNRGNAQKRRAELATEDSEPDGASTHSEAPIDSGEHAVEVARLSATDQARALARLVEELPARLADYVSTLNQVGDLDAAGRQIETARREANRQIETATVRADDAEAEAQAARAELEEEQAARLEAEAATELASQRSEQAESTAEQERDHARVADERAQTAHEQAAAEVDEVRRQTEADAREVRAERDRLLEQHRQAHAVEVETIRAETARQVDEQRARASEAEQARARAEQRATDAEADAARLRDQLDELTRRHRDELAELRQAHQTERDEVRRQAIEDRRILKDTYEERLAELRTAYTGSGEEPRQVEG